MYCFCPQCRLVAALICSNVHLCTPANHIQSTSEVNRLAVFQLVLLYKAQHQSSKLSVQLGNRNHWGHHVLWSVCSIFKILRCKQMINCVSGNFLLFYLEISVRQAPKWHILSEIAACFHPFPLPLPMHEMLLKHLTPLPCQKGKNGATVRSWASLEADAFLCLAAQGREGGTEGRSQRESGKICEHSEMPLVTESISESGAGRVPLGWASGAENLLFLFDWLPSDLWQPESCRFAAPKLV